MASPPTTTLFRPSKKRKIYRQRALEDEDAAPPTAPELALQTRDELISSAAAPEVADAPVSMAEILRLRKQKKRVGGVEFRAAAGQREEENALTLREGEETEGELMAEGGLGVGLGPRKFAPQTGTVGDVNRHMMAYIDSELAKRRAEGLQQQQVPVSTVSSPSTTVVSGLVRDQDVQRQPAALGKLQEIDLGDEARERNVKQTERAKRILDGEEVLEETVGKKVKVRLGPDGKPWRGRRKRRGSDDVKRDQLVEAVMRENRLEIYEEPVPEPVSMATDDQAADDRIAEAFRREFMDAQSARRQKKAAPAQPQARNAAGKEEEALKGPKLGGSRTARAAMREHMLKNPPKK